MDDLATELGTSPELARLDTEDTVDVSATPEEGNPRLPMMGDLFRDPMMGFRIAAA